VVLGLDKGFLGQKCREEMQRQQTEARNRRLGGGRLTFYLRKVREGWVTGLLGPGRRRQRQQQIPCGDDDQKGKGNDNGLVVVVAGRKWTQ
jgi:hypothetical protein